jgi:3-oxoacyl-[acyl-carrier-protein] synthase-3
VNNTRAVITGIGSYAPAKVLNNLDFEKMVDTSDEWIRTRTGIRERRIKENGAGTSDLALEASKVALRRAKLEPEDLDLILFGTVTPDYQVPSAACMLQQKMGAVNAAAMDVGAACASFIFGLATGSAYIGSGAYKRILVIGAESLSSITDYQDRSTCVLFGDGAGAVVLEARNGPEEQGILGTYIQTDGRHFRLLWIPISGSVTPVRPDNVHDRGIYLAMAGSEVFKLAVRAMCSASEEACRRAGVAIEDVDLLIPHQANIRIINALMKRMNIPEEKVFVNIEKYGNTSSASVPLALDEAYASGRIKAGDNVLMVAFGGGMAWGASLVRF